MKTIQVLVFCLMVFANDVHVLFGYQCGRVNHMEPVLPIQQQIYTVSGIGDVSLPTYNGWIVMMQRFDGWVNFYKKWAEYKNGFGVQEGGEFWLGNEIVHRLTNSSAYFLHIEVQVKASGEWYYADYDNFSLDSEANKYTLHVSAYSGDAGDALTDAGRAPFTQHNGIGFSTWDSDNAITPWGHNCPALYPGGWWFSDPACYHSCLTCQYFNKYGFVWTREEYPPRESRGLLRAARMLIKRK